MDFKKSLFLIGNGLRGREERHWPGIDGKGLERHFKYGINSELSLIDIWAEILFRCFGRISGIVFRVDVLAVFNCDLNCLTNDSTLFAIDGRLHSTP